jgi:protein-S-isoprenylcysteine O-methyltransferase Ste14
VAGSAGILVPFAVTAIIMAAFVVTERRLRRDPASKTLRATEHDKGTTGLVGAAFGASWMVLVLSLPANFSRTGIMRPALLFNVAGIILMLCGYAVRTAAARTLGRFYSRTLRMKDDHRVVSEGIYSSIRHPGYLGVMLMFLGAGLAAANYIVLAAIAALIIPAYLHRIAVEERMLFSALGKDYAEYARRTKRLLPFVY